MLNGWKYYNHALLPTVAPHKTINTEAVENGNIWRIHERGLVLLARWTSDWDCGQETQWWYCLIDHPLDLSKLKAKRRYEHTKAAKNFHVVKVEPLNYLNEIFTVQVQAFAAYPNKYRPRDLTKEKLRAYFESGKNYDTYVAFNRQDNTIAGYAIVENKGEYANFLVQKTIPAQEKLGVNMALVDGILNDYAERLADGFYIVDGERCVNHETGFQDYLVKYAGFRKAYCHMHIAYRPCFSPVVSIIYPFRRILKCWDENSMIHKLNALLKMEEIARSFK